ncbi:hypothetical protein K461DRAFT_273714 [Myriangium duriaei CBS 260.36]|uniref:CENP-V/GFA domain-containing protein n=1 Tax=Myriangium duriaei CBS 260.36 TaxID=1168546 RepID=A0A9P4J8Y8_9PEZI|nr:hypothetical protein K461DRAFT_273714 [Myriangium duriaei CBS 260.36]
METACHCGGISISAPRPEGPLNECPCGLCYRYGAVWAYYPLDKVTITKREGSSTRMYIWGDKVIQFHFCDNCYGMVYWWPIDVKKATEMGVNTRMVLDKKDLEGLEVIQDPPREWES